MSNRITKKDIKERFDYVCHVMGWSQDCWYQDGEGKNKSNIGAVYLDYAPIYGGYAVNQMVNEGGAIRTITSPWRRYSPKEFMAWLDGVALGYSKAKGTA